MSETLEREVRVYRVTGKDGKFKFHHPQIHHIGDLDLSKGPDSLGNVWKLVSRHRLSIPVPEGEG